MKKTLLTLFLATVLAVVVVGTPMGGGKCETSSDCVAPNGKIPFLLHYTIGQKSSNYPKIHLSEIQFFIKATFLKSHSSQNSPFRNLIFHKTHIFEISKSMEFLDKKWGFAPVCVY